MSRVRKCFHSCHGPIAVLDGVPVDDPLEAEAACDVCKDEHPARRHSGVAERVPRTYLPPTDWRPQADGEGAE